MVFPCKQAPAFELPVHSPLDLPESPRHAPTTKPTLTAAQRCDNTWQVSVWKSDNCCCSLNAACQSVLGRRPTCWWGSSQQHRQQDVQPWRSAKHAAIGQTLFTCTKRQPECKSMLGLVQTCLLAQTAGCAPAGAASSPVPLTSRIYWCWSWQLWPHLQHCPGQGCWWQPSWHALWLHLCLDPSCLHLAAAAAAPAVCTHTLASLPASAVCPANSSPVAVSIGLSCSEDQLCAKPLAAEQQHLLPHTSSGSCAVWRPGSLYSLGSGVMVCAKAFISEISVVCTLTLHQTAAH